jgi:hypothetical protein
MPHVAYGQIFLPWRPSASGTQKTSGSVKLRSYAGQAVADVIKQFFFQLLVVQSHLFLLVFA